nr:nicotinamide riboside transporter PnuC [Acetobacter persici]
MTMSPLEIVGVTLNVTGVWLTARRNMWCWPVGIAGVLVYGYLFWQWRLYGDMSLQVLYVALQAYGWHRWRAAGTAEAGGGLVPVLGDRHSLIVEIAVTGVLSMVLAWLMTVWTDDAMPRMDAVLTCFSLLAAYWAARRYIQNWTLWISVDAVYSALFLYLMRH